MLEPKHFVCRVVILIVLPSCLLSQDAGRAMLYSDGGVWINGNLAPASTAIFPHDTIQTQKTGTAKLDAEGSTITIQPDTVLQFEGDELVLDHGGLQVTTSRAMKVHVNCLTVIPITQDWTRYEVTDVDGKVKVSAFQNDVKIHSNESAIKRAKSANSSDTIVHQGEQATRDEHCVAAARPSEGISGIAPYLDTWWAKGPALAGIGVLTCWALCRGGNPMSPDAP